MNERIKELLKQAGVGDNWNKADWYSMSPEMIKKFAELIVRECIDTAFHKGHPDLEFLLKHFGVEP